jgi:hypothetical protein
LKVEVSEMYFTILFAIFLAVVRVIIGFNVEPEHFTWVQLYKDFAHLFMGGLFAFWLNQKKAWQWRLFWILNVVEVAVAVFSRI